MRKRIATTRWRLAKRNSRMNWMTWSLTWRRHRGWPTNSTTRSTAWARRTETRTMCMSMEVLLLLLRRPTSRMDRSMGEGLAETATNRWEKRKTFHGGKRRSDGRSQTGTGREDRVGQFKTRWNQGEPGQDTENGRGDGQNQDWGRGIVRNVQCTYKETSVRNGMHPRIFRTKKCEYHFRRWFLATPSASRKNTRIWWPTIRWPLRNVPDWSEFTFLL